MIDNIKITYPYTGYELASDGYCLAYNGPFGNCQNFCINDFAELLWVNNNEDCNYLVNYLRHLCNRWNRYFLVIDIKDNTYDLLKKLIKDDDLNISFVVETPYINNNGTSMVLCILNLNNLKTSEQI